MVLRTNSPFIVCPRDFWIRYSVRMEFFLKSIFGKRALRQLSSPDYVEWAGEMLGKGYDSHSLRILAGLDKFVSTDDAEDYFVRSIRELDPTIPETQDAIRDYAC